MWVFLEDLNRSKVAAPSALQLFNVVLFWVFFKHLKFNQPAIGAMLFVPFHFQPYCRFWFTLSFLIENCIFQIMQEIYMMCCDDSACLLLFFQGFTIRNTRVHHMSERANENTVEHHWTFCRRVHKVNDWPSDRRNTWSGCLQTGSIVVDGFCCKC